MARKTFVLNGSGRIAEEGVYVQIGSTAISWQMPLITPAARPEDNQEYILKNRGSAIWTFTANGGNLFYDGAAVASFSLAPGMSATVCQDGTYWIIRALSPRTKIRLLAVSSNTTFVVPANTILDKISIENTTANAITGGLNVGTTALASDVVLASAVGANALVVLSGSQLSKQFFSSSAPQTIYVSAVTSWNSASVNFSMFLEYLG